MERRGKEKKEKRIREKGVSERQRRKVNSDLCHSREKALRTCA